MVGGARSEGVDRVLRLNGRLHWQCYERPRFDWYHVITHKSMSLNSDPEDSAKEYDDGQNYEVERILDRKMFTNDLGCPELRYKIKWKGYENPRDQTWEPLVNLRNIPEMVSDFEREFKARKGKSKKQSQPPPSPVQKSHTPPKSQSHVPTVDNVEEKPRKLVKVDESEKPKKRDVSSGEQRKEAKPGKERQQKKDGQKRQPEKVPAEREKAQEESRVRKSKEEPRHRVGGELREEKVINHCFRQRGPSDYEVEVSRGGKIVGREVISGLEARRRCPESLTAYLEQFMGEVEAYNLQLKS